MFLRSISCLTCTAQSATMINLAFMLDVLEPVTLCPVRGVAPFYTQETDIGDALTTTCINAM